eukprot:TRINITY_DN9475_c1_g1_i1.p1 TRINITY_DN9475_c1_g1~~TRINITY_DN9475_c1_g1_i1.p1  ORF type:complete len:1325 (+),score=369.01 TRINITY_DN9475_c1_g1_i1:89-4063(+)
MTTSLPQNAVVDYLSGNNTGKQLDALLLIAAELSLGRDCTHWLPQVIKCGCAEQAESAVRKLTYHLARAQEQALTADDHAPLRKALAADLGGNNAEVALYGLRLLASLRMDRLKAFLETRAASLKHCLTDKNHKVREAAVDVLRELAACGPRAHLTAPELGAAHTAAFVSAWLPSLREAIFDPTDVVSAAGFLCLREVLRTTAADELAQPALCVDSEAAAAVAADYPQLLERAERLAVSHRPAALRPLTMLALWATAAPDSPQRPASGLAQGLLRETLRHGEAPQVVSEAARCVMFITAALAPQQQQQPDAAGLGATQLSSGSSPLCAELLWAVSDAVADLVSAGGAGAAHSEQLVRELTGALSCGVPDHLQWSCAVRFLQAAVQHVDSPASQHADSASAQLRLLLLTAGFDAACGLAVRHAARRLQSGAPYSPRLWKEFASFAQFPFWSGPFQAEGSLREELVCALCTSVAELRDELPLGPRVGNEGAALLAAWSGVGMQTVAMCLPAFSWSERTERVGVLHHVLRLQLKVQAEGVAVLSAVAAAAARPSRGPSPSADSASIADWAHGVREQRITQQRDVAELLITGQVGNAVRTVTKVCFLCTLAVLFPTLQEVREDHPAGMELLSKYQNSVFDYLRTKCSQFLLDEKESQCLALFDALLYFGARRGGNVWRVTNTVVEGILHDAGRSGSAPQALQVVKHKVDNLRIRGRDMLDAAQEGPGMDAGAISECSVSVFSEHHPVLHHELAPADHSLELQCHSARADLQAACHRRVSCADPAAEDTAAHLDRPSGSGDPDTAAHAEVITAPEDPVQVLAAYTWRRSRVELCLSVTNCTTAVLRDIRVTVGCHGEMVPLSRPQRPDFDTGGGAQELAAFKVHSRHDSIAELAPGQTAELVRVFLVASLTPGMGFSVLVDTSMRSGAEQEEGMMSLDGGGTGGEDICRMRCDFLALSLLHHLTQRHRLSLCPGKGALSLIAQLPHCRRLHTMHPRGDPRAIEQRIERQMRSTPFQDLSPAHNVGAGCAPAPLFMAYAAGVRGGGLLTLTVTATIVPGAPPLSGATAGVQLATAAEECAGVLAPGCVTLAWLWQAASAEQLECVLRHPGFHFFFEGLAGCDAAAAAKAQGEQSAAPPPAAGTAASLDQWRLLRKRNAATSQPGAAPTRRRRSAAPDEVDTESDGWGPYRCADPAAAEAGAAMGNDGGALDFGAPAPAPPAPQPTASPADLFGAAAPAPAAADPADLFGAPASSMPQGVYPGAQFAPAAAPPPAYPGGQQGGSPPQQPAADPLGGLFGPPGGPQQTPPAAPQAHPSVSEGRRTSDEWFDG